MEVSINLNDLNFDNVLRNSTIKSLKTLGASVNLSNMTTSQLVLLEVIIKLQNHCRSLNKKGGEIMTPVKLLKCFIDRIEADSVEVCDQCDFIEACEAIGEALDKNF